MSDMVLTKDDATPTPPAGTVSIYPKSDGLFYTKDDAGTESPLKGATGETGATGAAGPSMWTGTGTFTVVNNQTSAADVTDFLIDPATYRGFVAEYSIYRNTTSTGATELSETGFLLGAFKTVAGAWFLTAGAATEESTGVTFSITAAGQIQYVSTNITGTPAASVLVFKWRGFAI